MSDEPTKPVPVPTSKDLKELVEMLVGKAVTLTPGDPVDATEQQTVLAVFTDKSVKMRALMLCDMTLANAMGAALGLLPAAPVLEDAAQGKISKLTLENTYEILNVASSMFNKDDTPHLKLYKVTAPPDKHAPDALKLSSQRVARLDSTLGIDGYGSGSCSIVVSLF